MAGDLAALEELLAALTGPVTVVIPSSGGTVYDPAGPPPYREGDPVIGSTAYAGSRLAMERAVLDRARTDRAITPVILRISNAYGPGQRTGRGQGVVAHWLEAVAQGRPIEVFGDPATARDYVHVADIAAAFVRVHELGSEGRPLPAVVNIASGVPVTLHDLLAVVREVVSPVEPEVRWHERRDFDRPAVWLDRSLAARSLDWEPRLTLAAGVADAWRAVRADADRPGLAR